MNTEICSKTIISDLHLCDDLRFADCKAKRELVTVVEHTAAMGGASSAPAELVLAGDVFDFLRCAPWRCGPWSEAMGKLHGAARANPLFFDALRRFVGAGNRLVVLAGNHDVELAIPEVQQTLISLVAPPGDAAARARVVFPNDAPLPPHFVGRAAGPFALRSRGLHIEHGNQLDPFNAFDHGRFYEDESETRVSYPLGSHFVLGPFNDLSAEYPFIDKLLPHEAGLLVVWVIDPRAVRTRIPALAALGGRLYPELRRWYRASRAGASGAKGGVASDLAPEEANLAWLGQFTDDLEAVDRGAALARSTLPGSKGAPDVPRAVSVAAARILRAALTMLTAQRGTLEKDDAYADRAFAIAAAEGADVIVLGHSHEERDIRRSGRRYLNSGTWAGLVELDLPMLAEGDPDYSALLARLRDPRCFRAIERYPFVEITYPQGEIQASLRVVRGGAIHPVRAL